MSDLERILSDIPEHEIRAKGFIDGVNDLNNKFKTLTISAELEYDPYRFSGEFNDFMEEMLPGSKRLQQEFEDKLEIESVDKTGVTVSISGKSKTIIMIAQLKVDELAKKFKGKEDVENREDDSDKNGIVYITVFDFKSSDS